MHLFVNNLTINIAVNLGFSITSVKKDGVFDQKISNFAPIFNKNYHGGGEGIYVNNLTINIAVNLGFSITLVKKDGVFDQKIFAPIFNKTTINAVRFSII